MQINGISLWRKFIPQDIVENNKESASEDSLVVQWLGLHASTAGGMGSIPGQGIKILPAKNEKKIFSVIYILRIHLIM